MAQSPSGAASRSIFQLYLEPRKGLRCAELVQLRGAKTLASAPCARTHASLASTSDAPLYGMGGDRGKARLRHLSRGLATSHPRGELRGLTSAADGPRTTAACGTSIGVSANLKEVAGRRTRRRCPGRNQPELALGGWSLGIPGKIVAGNPAGCVR